MALAERLKLILFAFAVSMSLGLIASANTPGSSFTPHRNGDFWLSNNGTFTFGFKQVASNQYILAIWLSEDVNETALWWPNFGEIPTVDADATLTFTNGGNVELLNSKMAVVWSSNTSNSGVSSAEMLDTGNLVLYNTSGGTVWQSNLYLTDTLVLPNEGPLTGLHLQSAQFYYLLQSRQNMTSYGQGGYSLVADSYLNLYLSGVDQHGNNFTFWYAVMNTTGNFQILQSALGVVFDNNNYTIDQSVRRFTLDYDGNPRVYSFNGSKSSSWQLIWEAIDDRCKVGSPCGQFGLCEVIDGKINCTCPPGYFAMDDRDLTQGCNAKVSFNATCAASNGSDYNETMAEVDNFDYDYNDLFPSNVPTVDSNTCKSLCLQDCSCMAASYKIDGSALCYLKGNNKTGYLLMGYQTSNNNLFVKVVTASASSQGSGRGGGKARAAKKARIAVGTVAAAVVVLLFGAAGWWCRRGEGVTQGGRSEEDVSGGGPVRFSYDELVKATKNFSELLGEGGFGKVYKGWVAGRKEEGSVKVVAVKVLKMGSEGAGGAAAAETQRQFRAEVATLGRIHHINLVQLFGFCTDGGRRLLVYEYMANGSLDKFVCRPKLASAPQSTASASFATTISSSGSSASSLLQPPSPSPAPASAPSSSPSSPLPWRTRFSIALGTARGVSYLHNDCHQCIIHCDIKPQNILLDSNFSPKVADFGLAKLFHHRDDHLSMSAVRGTRGYLAPEWLGSDEITAKADVYSFGMVLLELVRGDNMKLDRGHLRDWAYQSITSKDSTHRDQLPQDQSLYDPGSEQHLEETKEQQRLLRTGLWCIQHSPSLRPNMSRVVNMLEGTVPVEDPPYPTAVQQTDSPLSEGGSDAIHSYTILSAR